MLTPCIFTWLWKSKCTPRIKFFGWLILIDRLIKHEDNAKAQEHEVQQLQINLACQQVDAHPIFARLWKSKCTPRIKFFGWLIMIDRLNTKTMLRHRNLNVEDNYVLCVLCADRYEEDVDNLFFTCQFSKRC